MGSTGMPFPLDWDTYRWHTVEKSEPVDEKLSLVALGMWVARYLYPWFLQVSGHRAYFLGGSFSWREEAFT